MNIRNYYPKVSIITATYRNFKSLFSTIDSVLKQDYPNIEYIISDDGSEGFPKQEVYEYIEKNKRSNIISFKVIHNTINIGTVKNLNQAYRMSEGKYIFNLSCNDIFFEETTVSKIVERFQKNHSLVIVTTRLAYLDNKLIEFKPHYLERKVIQKLDTPYKQYKAFITARFYDMASGSAMYFSRDILEQMNYFDEKYTLWEDGPFLAKYLWNHRLDFCYDIISILYEEGGISSGSGSINPIYEKDIILFFKEEKKEHYKEVDYCVKQNIKYSEQIYCDNKRNKILIYISYWPQVILYIFYKFKRKYYEKYDKEYIKKINLSKILIK